MTNRKEIGALAKQHRKQRKLTQAQACALCGVNKSTISSIENGRFTGSLAILELYLNSLGLALFAAPIKPNFPAWHELSERYAEDLDD